MIWQPVIVGLGALLAIEYIPTSTGWMEDRHGVRALTLTPNVLLLTLVKIFSGETSRAVTLEHILSAKLGVLRLAHIGIKH